MTSPARVTFPQARRHVVAPGERLNVFLEVADLADKKAWPTVEATWVSSDPTILSVEAEGTERRVVGHRPGSVLLEVTWRDVRVHQEMHVLDPAVVHRLVFQEWPSDGALVVHALHDHGRWTDATGLAQWSSSDDSVVRFDRPGVPLPGRDGHAVVTAQHGGLAAAREVDCHAGRVAVMPATFHAAGGRSHLVRGIVTRVTSLWYPVTAGGSHGDDAIVATADPPGAATFSLHEGTLRVTGVVTGPVTIGIRLRTLRIERRFEVRDEAITMTGVWIDGKLPGPRPLLAFVGETLEVGAVLRAPDWHLDEDTNVVFTTSDPSVLSLADRIAVGVAPGLAVVRAQCRDVVVEHAVQVCERPEIEWF